MGKYDSAAEDFLKVISVDEKCYEAYFQAHLSHRFPYRHRCKHYSIQNLSLIHIYFFSLISNTCGGYSFYKDAKLLRLTRYRYNNIQNDEGGRYYYIKDGNTVWNPGWQPVKAELDSYDCLLYTSSGICDNPI